MAPLFKSFGQPDLHNAFTTQPAAETRQIIKRQSKKAKSQEPSDDEAQDNKFQTKESQGVKVFEQPARATVAISMEPLTTEDVALSHQKTNIFRSNIVGVEKPFVLPDVEPVQLKTDPKLQLTDALNLRFGNAPRGDITTAQPMLGEVKYVKSAVKDKASRNIHRTYADKYAYDKKHASLEGDRVDWNGVQEGGQLCTVKLRMYTLLNDPYPHLDFQINLHWIANGSLCKRISMFGFHANNIAAVIESKQVATRADLRGAFVGVNESELTKDTTEVGIVYYGGAHYANNMSSDVDFGPFTETMRQMRLMLEQGCKIFAILATPADISRYGEVITALSAAKTDAPPYSNWLEGDRWTNVEIWDGSRILPLEDRPKIIHTARINYLNLLEYVITEGYGLVREHELAVKGKAIYVNVTARIIQIPGAQGREIILLVQRNSHGAAYDLEIGDRVTVNIQALNPNDLGVAYWKGEVMTPLPYGQQHDASIRLSRPFKATETDPEGEYFGLDPEGLEGTTMYTSFDNAISAKKIINNSATFLVDIHKTEHGVSQYKHQINGLRMLQENIAWEKDQVNGSVTEEILLANNFERLPKLDLFKDVDEGTLAAARSQLLPSQIDTFDSFRTQLGGLSLVVGAPGSGKSHLLIRAVLVHLASKTDLPRQALLVAQHNVAVSKLAVDIHNMASTRSDVEQPLVVIRLQSPSTEANHFSIKMRRAAAEAGATQQRPAKVDRDLRAEAVKATLPAAKVFDMAVQQHLDYFLVADPRLDSENHKMSLAYQAMLAAGIIDDPGCPSLQWKAEAQGEKFGEIAAVYQNAMEQGLPGDDKIHFEELTSKLFKWTLENADVVCATLERISDINVYTTISPSMIAVDEAGRATSAELRNVRAGFPGCHHHIWLGDPEQSGPRVQSKPGQNVFRDQMLLSDFTRLLMSGFPASQIPNQYRYCQSINDVISPIFYKGEVQASDTLASHETTMKFARYLETSLGLPPGENVALIDVADAPERKDPITKSKSNPNSAAVTWSLVERLVRAGFDPKGLAIYTPYSAQKFGHDQVRLQLTAMAQQEIVSPSSSARDEEESTHSGDDATSGKDDAASEKYDAASSDEGDAASEHSESMDLDNAEESHSHSPAPIVMPTYQDVYCQTWDSIQGTERDIIIVDITSSDTLGFIDDVRRVNTCLTRAKYGLLLVADVKRLMLIDRFNNKALGTVFDNLKGRGLRHVVKDAHLTEIVECYTPMWPDNTERPIVHKASDPSPYAPQELLPPGKIEHF